MTTVKRVLAENYVRPDESEKVKSFVREKGGLKVIDKVTVALNEKKDIYNMLSYQKDQISKSLIHMLIILILVRYSNGSLDKLQ